MKTKMYLNKRFINITLYFIIPQIKVKLGKAVMFWQLSYEHSE